MNYRFRNGLQAGDISPSKALNVNIVEYLKWACLEAGWFRQVLATDAGISTGGSGSGPLPPSQMMPVRDPVLADGRVWENRRTNFVWETGLTSQPSIDTTVSVYVDGGLVSPTLYTVDYQQGRILFASPIALTSVVTVSHIRRLVQIADIETPWVHRLDSYSLADDDIRRTAAIGTAGDLAVAPSRRIQLPAVGVLPVFDFQAVPYELGSSTLLGSYAFDLIVVAETPWERAWLHDSMVAQLGQALPTFDVSLSNPPYNTDGSLSSSAQTFPVLCESNPWLKCWIKEVRSGDSVDDGSLFKVRVRWRVEIQGM